MGKSDFGKRKKSEKVRLWKKEKVRKSRLDFGKTKKSDKVTWTLEKAKSLKKSCGLRKKEIVQNDFGKRKKSEKVRPWKKENVRKSPTLEKGKSPKKSDFGKREKSQKVRLWKKEKVPKRSDF